jgi:hypothetical protein
LESHSFLHQLFFARKEFTSQVSSREDRDKKTERRESGWGRERRRPDANYALQGPPLFNFFSSQQLWVRTPDVFPHRRWTRSMQCQLFRIVVFLSKSRCSTNLFLCPLVTPFGFVRFLLGLESSLFCPSPVTPFGFVRFWIGLGSSLFVRPL